MSLTGDDRVGRYPVGVATIDDAALVERLRARDETTFAALVPAWSPVMIRVALGHVGSRASAEEVVQETWLAVVTGVGAFEGRSSLRTWVLRICANVARRHAAKEWRVRPSGLPLDEGPTVDPGRFRPAGGPYAGGWLPGREPVAPGPEAQAVTAEAGERIADALRRLPRRQADVVALRDLHGLGGAEVAELLDTTEGNVRVLLHRGRAALRQQLEDYYRGGVVGR